MSMNYRVEEVGVAVMHLDEFMSSLPACFHRDVRGKIYHDPDEANLFLDERKLFVNARKKILKFKDIDEFDLIKHRILTVPTYLTVTLTEEDVDLEKRTGTWHHFMICINPKHPSIRPELVENLAKCENLMKKGKYFAFHFRLGPSLSNWYEIVNELPYYSSRSFNSTICLTNFMEEWAMCYSPLLWTAVFPLMFLICGPYILYRFVACKTFSVRVRACITLVIGNHNQGSNASQDHLCIIRRRRNPLVSSTTQQPNLYQLELDEMEEQMFRPKHSAGLYYRHL